MDDGERRIQELHLVQAERRVLEAERTISHQRRIVAELERDAHDATSAAGLLALFEELLRLHVADRDRLRKELGVAAPR